MVADQRNPKLTIVAAVPAAPNTVALFPSLNALAYSSDAADDFVPRTYRTARTLPVSKRVQLGARQ